MTTPLFERIAADIREQIADGQLNPGDRLPTETELADQYSTTRVTVRRGISVLVNEGLVVSKRPQGKFVRDRQPMTYRPQDEFDTHSPDLDLFTGHLQREGNGREGQYEIEVAITRPTPQIRQRLRLADDQDVVARRRTLLVDGQPFNIDDSYCALSDVAGSAFMSPHDVPSGTNHVLAELGLELVTAVDEIAIRMPTPAETERLHIVPGTPVAELMSTAYAGDERPVQVTVTVLPGDRNVIVYGRQKSGASDQ